MKKYMITIPVANTSEEQLKPIAEHFDCEISRVKNNRDYYNLSTDQMINFFWFGINLPNKLKI